MALCTFSENYLMLGVTPVENLFIQEYLPRASGDYVRVYLYGLMQCYHPGEDMTLERTAHILDLSVDTVRDAFQYWERQGLIRRVSDRPVAYQYLNIASTMLNESPMEQDIYRHRDFNNQLQQLFGNRLLHSSEFNKACEWVEDLHLPEKVVLMMVESYIEGHGQKCQFKSLDKVAMKWAEEEIFTEELAREKILCESAAWKLCEQVLKQFSLHRKPTKAELETADKWLNEWNLSPKAVVAACRETVNARNPNFGYLDGILKRYTNITSGVEMSDSIEQQGKIHEALKEIKKSMGLSSILPTPDEQELYRSYLEAGFLPETVLRVAAYLAQKKPRSTELLFDYLEDFRRRGQITSEEIAKYLSLKKELRKQTREVYMLLGKDGEIYDTDIAQLEDWLKLASLELIQYAAECSRGKQVPTTYITKLLKDWKKLDLTTLELVKRHMESSHPVAPASQATDRPTPTALNYPQRTYQEGELDYIFTDLSQYMEDNKNDAQ